MKFNTLRKAIEIFDFFLERESVVTVNEITQALKMPRSTTFAYLAFLKKHGFINDSEVTGEYRLGLRFLEYAYAIRSQIPLTGIALPYMRKLAASVEETVGLSIPITKFSCMIERIQKGTGILYTMQLGSHIPLHCGSTARTLLAFKPDDEIKKYIKETTLKSYNDKQFLNPAKLWDNLMEVRKRGYAYSEDEIEVGVKGVASPIFNDEDQVIAALVVAGPSTRMNKKKVNAVKNEVIEATTKISQELGYQYERNLG
ncbi:IclR family transcriptional regulator [Thermodesulfobacteriota bacterium]